MEERPREDNHQSENEANNLIQISTLIFQARPPSFGRDRKVGRGRAGTCPIRSAFAFVLPFFFLWYVDFPNLAFGLACLRMFSADQPTADSTK
jgi:hypothetical protein